MQTRALFFWLICGALAVLAVGAAEPASPDPSVFSLSEEGMNTLQPVPEPSRALMLFLGIMAMAFTYRRAWLNWRREG